VPQRRAAEFRGQQFQELAEVGLVGEQLTLKERVFDWIAVVTNGKFIAQKHGVTRMPLGWRVNRPEGQ